MPTKYENIARSLREKIRGGEYAPGEALPSEVALSEEYDVNRLTLRKALDVLEDEGKVVRHRGRGTFVKFAEQQRQSGTVLYIGETESHFYKDLYLAICREAQASGQAAVGYSPAQDGGAPSESAHLRKLLEDASGVICDADHWAGVLPVVPDELPVVRLSKTYSESPLESDERPGYVVAADNLRAARYATRHLVDLGHRRIGYLCVADEDGGPYGLGRPHPMRPVYQGYLTALREAGIDEEYVIPFPPTNFQEGGREALRSFIEQVDELPTGFVCDGDFRAAPLVQVLQEEGLRAPDDFSVVGVGNTPWCGMISPPLTSVSLRESELARLAVMLCHRTPADSVAVLQVRPTLIKRNSTAPPPSHCSPVSVSQPGEKTV